jgi:uncharacterized protein YecT (DUF1311 family)
MKCIALALLVLNCSCLCVAQDSARDISPSQLQSILSLPLDQAIQQREPYKVRLNDAYQKQIALTGKDCLTEQGQQSYNICMGTASQQGDSDLATFYNNLQMLCHTQSQLLTMQASQAAWNVYKDSTMKAAFASWPAGTGAPGFAGEVYLTLQRDRMRELHQIYALNISQ